MKRIQGPGGESLGPTYDVEGTSVAVQELDDDTVHLVDTMGQRIHSERVCAVILHGTSGAIAANTAFNFTLPVLPDCPNRLVGLSVIAKGGGGTSNFAIFIRDPTLSRETCIWAWDETNDLETLIRVDINGAGVSGDRILVPHKSIADFPILLTRIGTEAPNGVMPEIIVHGQTEAATGDTFHVFAHVIRPASVIPAAGEPSSHGLPIPSW